MSSRPTRGKGDNIVPYLLKFRETVERLAHYAAIERLAVSTEVGQHTYQGCKHEYEAIQQLIWGQRRISRSEPDHQSE